MRNRPSAHASGILGSAASQVHWHELSADVQRQAVDIFLDTLGIIAAGMAHESYRPFVRSLGREPGTCTVLGLRDGVPIGTAALLNGGATTVLQWQDGHRRARGHPASHLVPVLLGLAEERGLRANEVMGAFVAGYEVGARIGIALGGLQEPLHDAGNWATIGAAAGAAHLFGGRDGGVVREAVDTAAAIALFPDREAPMRGATIHHLYIGTGCATAITVAKAVEAGLTSGAGTLEHFFGHRAGADYQPSLLLDGVGSDGRFCRYEILEGYLKWHPVCAHMSAIADAAHRLSAREPDLPQLAHEIIVSTYETALGYNVDRPTNDLAARFSIPSIVAAILLGEPLSSALLDRSDFTSFRSRVVAVHEPEMDSHYPAARPARIRAHLGDGRMLEETALHPYGDARNPMTVEDRRAKLERALAQGLGSAAAVRIPEAFADYLAGAEISEFSAVLRSFGTSPYP